MNVEIAVFLLIFLSISSLATIGICFVEFRQNAAFLFPSNVQNIGETFMVFFVALCRISHVVAQYGFPSRLSSLGNPESGKGCGSNIEVWFIGSSFCKLTLHHLVCSYFWSKS